MATKATKARIACVTGATGFLASELVSQLLAGGYTVQATVRSLNDQAKTQHLRDFPSADSNLRLFEADLLSEGAFDSCVAGADVVFHAASPFITSNVTDPEAELYRPALEGTRNVFASIKKTRDGRAKGPPRVVLTSSVAAVMGKATDKDTCFDEDDWNFSSRPEGSPPGDGLDLYRYSKLVAEREAWSLARELGLEMAAICPSFIMGPPRTPRLDGESISNMAMALEGVLPHRGDTPIVDVRDCAAAHVAAGELPAAAGRRFITSSGRPMQRSQMLRWLAEAHPELEIHDAGEPKEQGSLRQLLCPQNLPLLNMTLREPRETIVDMAAAMLRLGAVAPKRREGACR